MVHTSVPSISAIVLTLNEEATVAGAIKSLSWCDEIFVVDSDSRDATREIAESLGARVYLHRQDGQFLISKQRNWAIDNLPVQSEWILFLDADEESTLAFQESVEASLREAGSCTSFYAAPAFMYYGKWLKHISGYPNWHPRIVLAKSGTRFTGGVWEDFDQPHLARHISEPYIHRTNAKGLSDWIEKHLRYASWEGQRIHKHSSDEITSTRRTILRKIRYSLGPFRKYLTVLYLAFIRGGFLDGREGRSYLRRMFIYELLIDEIVKEQAAKASKVEL